MLVAEAFEIHEFVRISRNENTLMRYQFEINVDWIGIVSKWFHYSDVDNF